MGFDSGMGAFPAMFMIVFVLIIGVFIIGIIGSITNYAKNASAPILTTNAKVVVKRTNVTRHNHFDSNTHVSHSTNSTTYYTTFETEAGERIELKLSGKEYGLLAENDEGELIYQGEWFKKFTRSI